MPTSQQWRDERATILKTARDIVDGAKAASRELTSVEHAKVEHAITFRAATSPAALAPLC